MTRKSPDAPPPSCYAIVQPGLEEIAAEEVAQSLGGEVKRTGKGLVVFRVPQIDERLLRLRTTEDVFLLAWGTDDETVILWDVRRDRQIEPLTGPVGGFVSSIG